jgi:hypothetical protein
MENNQGVNELTLTKLQEQLDHSAQQKLIYLIVFVSFLVACQGYSFISASVRESVKRGDLVFILNLYIPLVFIITMSFVVKGKLKPRKSALSNKLREAKTDIVWIYIKKTTIRLNFIIPISTQKEFVFADKNGRKYYCEYFNYSEEQLIKLFEENFPDVFWGYSREVNNLYNSNPQRFLEQINIIKMLRSPDFLKNQD